MGSKREIENLTVKMSESGIIPFIFSLLFSKPLDQKGFQGHEKFPDKNFARENFAQNFSHLSRADRRSHPRVNMNILLCARNIYREV